MLFPDPKKVTKLDNKKNQETRKQRRIKNGKKERKETRETPTRECSWRRRWREVLRERLLKMLASPLIYDRKYSSQEVPTRGATLVDGVIYLQAVGNVFRVRILSIRLLFVVIGCLWAEITITPLKS